MSLGNQWTGLMTSGPDVEESEKILDTFYEAGGNFIDTANNYQDNQSEMIIGEWMEKRQNRDEMVVATKYTVMPLNKNGARYQGIAVNYGGNHRKSMLLSLEASLKRLRTTYVDIYYLHVWDYTTSVAEVMQALHQLVLSGKVHYLGISDTPAWIVSEANTYARAHGLTPFAVYQGWYNLAKRDLEREIIPMCRAHGMSIAGYSVLGGGSFKTAAQREAKKDVRWGFPPSEADLKASAALEEVAAELGNGVTLTGVAMAWARQVVADFIPIVGGSDAEKLKANIEALKITLTFEQMEKLANAVPFDRGFPSSSFGTDPHYRKDGIPNGMITTTAGHIVATKLPGLDL
ncbi:hypothetical protein P7C73_g6592, partial [Tremellales sp. Uapishka_1]